MDNIVDLIPNGETVLPVKADPTAPIDLLGRKEIVKRIMDILEVISEKESSCTFALNGAWGTGKTFVLNMLMNQLWERPDDKYIVFHYNCWQYDYYEEPLIAIVAAMLDSVDENSHLISEDARTEVKAGIKLAKEALKRIGISLVKNKIGVDLTEALSTVQQYQEAIDIEKQAQEDSRSFDVFYSFKKAIEQAQEEIRNLAKDRTLVVVVDELDRCLPSYAIKVLERLHHLFVNVNRMAVILAVDKKQLDNMVMETFGQHTNTTDYLRKFIDFELQLHSGNIKGKRFTNKYNDFLNQYYDLNYPFTLSLDEFITCLFDGIPMRVLERMIARIKTTHDVLFPGMVKDQSFLCCELAWLVLTEFYEIKEHLPFYYKDTIDEEGFQGFKLSLKLDNKFTAFFNSNWSARFVYLTSQYSTDAVTHILKGSGDLQKLLVYYLSHLYSVYCETMKILPLNIEFYNDADYPTPIRYKRNIDELTEAIKFFQIIQ